MIRLWEKGDSASKFLALATAVVFILTMLVIPTTVVMAAPVKDPSATFMGFGANQGGGGSLSLGYTTGNLGNTWAEGEWVPYQLVLTNVQSTWGSDPANWKDVEISYDFTNKGNRFIDLVRSIQVGTRRLSDTEAWNHETGIYPHRDSQLRHHRRL